MYKTILVPLDESATAERILPHVEDLALKFDAKVVFLKVMEPAAIIQHPQGEDFEHQLIKEREDEASMYVTARKGEFREKGIRAKGVVEYGEVVRTIITVAERESADLIAMTSHGRSALTQCFYGSVAAGILHRIDRPLLLIRSI